MRSLIRRWRRRPLGIVLATAIVALGVAANASLFAVLYAVVLAPLPYPASGRLFVIEDHNPERPGETRVVPGRYRDFVDQLRPYAEVAAVWPGLAFNSTDTQGAVRLSGQFVSDNLLGVLDRRVARGRAFVAGDMVESSQPVALISDDLWQRSYGRRTDIVGQTLRLNGLPYAVIGVLPADLPLPVAPADVWLPLQLGVWNRVSRNFVVIGRPAEDADVASVERHLEAAQQALAAAYPGTDAQTTPRLVGLSEVLAGDTRTPLSLVWVGSGLLLGLVALNLGVLLVARVVADRHEIAVRRALGATTAEVVLPAVGEAVLIAVCGAGAGIGLANLALPVVTVFVKDVTHAAGVAGAASLTWPVLSVSAFATLAVAGLAAAVPSILAARITPYDVLRVRHHGGGRLARRTLVAAQLAGALVLVSLAAFATEAVLRLRSVDLGLHASDVVTARVVVPVRGPGISARRRALADVWLMQLRRLPAIEAAAVGSALPFGGTPTPFSVWIEGSPARIQVEHRAVTPEYFDVLRIRVLAGRVFTDADRESVGQVSVVSGALAARIAGDRLLPGGDDVIGARISVDGPSGPWRTVVGIVDDTQHAGIGRRGRAEVYLPWAQDPWPSMALVVRHAPGRTVTPTELTATLAAVDGTLPVFDVRPLSARIDASMALQILLERSFLTFAALALVIAAFGVYGLLAWVVEARRFELGLRIALGARPSAITRLVLGELGSLASAGLVGGAVVVALSARWIASHVSDFPALEYRIQLACVLAVLGVVAVSALPAVRRAARTDPASTLRG